MLDRVREALFSTLGERVTGARVLDLYSGTGSLGLEALSRGASFVRFVERDAATRRVLVENVDALDVADSCEVIGGDALAAAARATPERLGAEERWIDLVLCDPPYALWKELRRRRGVLEALADAFRARLAPGGIAVLHTHPRDLAERELAFAAGARARDYNNSRLWYLEGAG